MLHQGRSSSHLILMVILGYLRWVMTVWYKLLACENLTLVTNNRTKLTLKVVRNAPNIHFNLISVGKLDDDGFCNTFSGGKWKLNKDSLVATQGKWISNLYLM